MRIGLIQVDGKWPNLALLKLSTYYRKQGHEVVFLDLSSYKFDHIFGSKIFMGGSGFSLKGNLPDDIECLEPDYEQFNMDHSIAFTTRGCIRDCGFCIVREKEGSLTEVPNWKEQIKHSKVLILDNNFLASKEWKEKLEFFIDNKIKVCFTQGLDIRLINKDNASILSKVKWYNHTFKGRALYFAFDHPGLKTVIKHKVKILIEAGIKPSYLTFYVLVGFNTTLEEDLDRIYLLRDLKARPFVMIYNNMKSNRKLRDIARWTNLNYYKVVDFKDYIPNRKVFGRH